MKALLASCFAALAVLAAPALADKKKQAVDDEDPLAGGTARKPDKAEKKKPKVEYVEDTPDTKKTDKTDKTDKPKKSAKPEYVDDDAKAKPKTDDKKAAKADKTKKPKADDEARKSDDASAAKKAKPKADDEPKATAKKTKAGDEPKATAKQTKADDEPKATAKQTKADDAAAKKKRKAEEEEAAKQRKVDEELAELLKKTRAEEAAAKKADEDRAKKARGGDAKKAKADEERERKAELEAKKAVEERAKKADELAAKKAKADEKKAKKAKADDLAANKADEAPSAKTSAKSAVKKKDDKKPAKAEPDEIELDPVVMSDDTATATASTETSVTVRRRSTKSNLKRLYVRAGVAHVAPLASSREMELADVDGAASLAVQNGPIAGSGASVSSATIPALTFGYRLTPRISVETILGAPFTVKFKATGTLANESIAPMALGIPTGVPALGSELGEAKAAPPTVTATYALLDKGPLIPYAGAGVAVLFAFDAKVTNPLLTEVSQPEFNVKPAPGLVLQLGGEAKLWKNIYARLDVKFIAFMLAQAEAKHIQVRTPELPLFDTVEVGTARMSVWVNPLIIQAGIGADF